MSKLKSNARNFKSLIAIYLCHTTVYIFYQQHYPKNIMYIKMIVKILLKMTQKLRTFVTYFDMAHSISLKFDYF